MSATAMLDEQERRDAEAFGRAYRALKDTSLPDSANPLQDPALRDFAWRLLVASRGPAFGADTRLPYVVWKDGVGNNGRDYWWDDDAKLKIYVPTPGLTFHSRKHKKYIVPNGTVAYVERVLRDRSMEIAEKHKGWIIHFTLNPNGFRDGENTLEVHALVLDSDDAGEWHTMLATLDAASVGYLAYQSGGHGPACPKWRIILPLSRPYDCREKKSKEAWNDFYHKCRVIFGSLGWLSKRGFDKNTSSVANNWYLCERRSPDAPPREVRVRYGASLDLVQFALGLPDIEEPRRERTHTAPLDIEESAVTPEEHELIVCGVSEVMEKMTHSRRDLCFALTDALADHGIPFVDIYRIVEDLWSCYDSKAQVAARRIVMYVERGWEDGDKARGQHSGALAKNFPEVMEALKLAIPDRVADREEAWRKARDEENEEFHRFLVEMGKQRDAERAAAAQAQAQAQASSPPRPPNRDLPAAYYEQYLREETPFQREPPKPKPIPNYELAREAKKIALRAAEKPETRAVAETIEAILTVMPVEGDVLMRVGLAVGHLAANLPSTTTWDQLHREVLHRFCAVDRHAQYGLFREQQLVVLMGHFEHGQVERRKWEAAAPALLEKKLAKRDQAHASARAALLALCPGGSKRSQ